MSLNLAMLIRVDICRQTDELFERLHNKPFWIWNTEQHKFEDKYLINTGKLLGVVLGKSRATLDVLLSSTSADNGNLTIQIPRDVVDNKKEGNADAPFRVHVDGKDATLERQTIAKQQELYGNTSSATPRSELMAGKEDAIGENAGITLYDMLTHLAERMQ